MAVNKIIEILSFRLHLSPAIKLRVMMMNELLSVFYIEFAKISWQMVFGDKSLYPERYQFYTEREVLLVATS